MSKATNYDKISKVNFLVETNNEVRQEDGTVKYQPITVTAQVNAITTEGGSRPVSKSATFGVLSVTPRTIQQLYTTMNNVNSNLGTLLKDLVLEAIDVDPSA